MAFLSICLFISCTSQHGKNDNIFIVPIAENISKPVDIKYSQFIDDFVPFNPQFMDADGNLVEFLNASKVSNWFRVNPSKFSDKIEVLSNVEITRNPVIMTGKSKTR